jgi:hypothetical protein
MSSPGGVLHLHRIAGWVHLTTDCFPTEQAWAISWQTVPDCMDCHHQRCFFWWLPVTLIQDIIWLLATPAHLASGHCWLDDYHGASLLTLHIRFLINMARTCCWEKAHHACYYFELLEFVNPLEQICSFGCILKGVSVRSSMPLPETSEMICIMSLTQDHFWKLSWPSEAALDHSLWAHVVTFKLGTTSYV